MIASNSQWESYVITWTLQIKHLRIGILREPSFTSNYIFHHLYRSTIVLSNIQLSCCCPFLPVSSRLKLLLDEGLYVKNMSGRRYAFDMRRAYSATTRSSNEDALTRSGCPQPAPQRSPGRRKCAHRTRR